MHGELLIESSALAFSQNLRLLPFPVGDLRLKVLMDRTRVHIVDTIQEGAKDAESLRHQSTDLS